MIRLIFLVFLTFFVPFLWAKPIQTRKVIVSGPSVHLVEAVEEIYRQGGNIFDAAIAGAFTLAVTHPYFVSLGCGGFALLQSKSDIQALDFREIAPAKVTEDFYIKSQLSPRKTGASVGVPGFVAGQWAIYQKYGSLPWSRLLQPAIKLANNGFTVSGQWMRRTKNKTKYFNITGKRIFFHSDGTPYMPGEYVKQKKLREALRLISRKGKTLFYNGVIGQDIVKTVNANKGVMSVEDLRAYQVRWLKPFKFSLGKYQVYTMPLPSSGGIILARASELMRQKNIRKLSLYSVSEWHLLGEVLSFSFRPRFQMGDISTPAPYLKQWLSAKKLTNLAAQISLSRVKKLSVLQDTISVKESTETTHFSIMNSTGEAISMTLTLNGNFGSFVVTDKYGIVLNNQMDDFNTRPGKPNQFGLIQGKNNKVLTGRRPLSSMSPTIVKGNGQVVMAVGAAGGPMIISSVLQILHRYLINGLDLDSSVQAPRIHHQFLPRSLFVEKNRFSPIVLQLLRKRGHNIKQRDSIAKAYAVSKRKDGLLEGAFDARGEGATGGF